jgi:hypothetical protein
MNMGEIVKDSLRYPFSDWKKFLIFGIISLIAVIFTIAGSIIPYLFIVGYLIGFFILGYSFKIIISSLSSNVSLPDFDDGGVMFKNGIKVFIVAFVYSLPAILIVLVVNYISSPSNIIEILSALLSGTIDGGIFLNLLEGGPGVIIAVLYMILVVPVLLMAVAHMANNSSKLGSAFNFKEIINKIATNGWTNLIAWYMLTALFVLIIYEIGTIVNNITNVINPYIGTIFISLILIPYISIFISRSVASFYNGFNLQISGKYITAIIILILAFLVLSFSADNISNIGNSNNITSYNSTTNTYSGSGVSFNFPTSWNVQTNYGSETDILLFNNDSSETLSFQLSIMPNPIGLSDQDTLDSLQNIQPQSGSQEILNTIIKVDGNTAYENIYTFNDPSISTVTMTDQQVAFVKNGKTYILDFMAPTTDYNNEKQNFDIILNTLKIK